MQAGDCSGEIVGDGDNVLSSAVAVVILCGGSGNNEVSLEV